MLSPARASARLVAAPKPLDDPTTNPQGLRPVSVMPFSQTEELSLGDARWLIGQLRFFDCRLSIQHGPVMLSAFAVILNAHGPAAHPST
jgi:hypothetical protein